MADESIWDFINQEYKRVGVVRFDCQPLYKHPESVSLYPNPYDKPDPRFYIDPDVYGVDLGSYVETYPTEDEARTAAKQQGKPFVVKDGDDPLADFLEED